MTAASSVPADRSFVAYVLISREFMHHLGFDEVRIEEPPGSRLPA